MKKHAAHKIVRKYGGNFKEFNRSATPQERKIVMSYNIKSELKASDHGKQGL